MAFGLLYWAVAGSLLTLVGGPLHWLLPDKQGKKLGRFLIHHLFRGFMVYLRMTGNVRVDASALDALGRIEGPFIAAPNHTSLWDAVYIVAKLPSAVCVMKKEILCNPVLGGGARLAGYVANKSKTSIIRDSSAALEEGGQLILFPEGTRTRPDARWINPLKGGCAIIASRTGVPIYPIFIRSDTRFLQKGWPLWRRPTFPILMHYALGAPITAQPGESVQDLTARLEAIYEHELAKPHPLRRQVAISGE